VTPWPKSKPTRLGRCSRDNIEGYVWDWALDKGGWVTATEQRGRLFLKKPVTDLIAAIQFSAAFC
jgi:hypothetical protein